MASTSLQRILIAEDEPDIQLIAQMALEAIGGFHVRLCSSGSEALRAAPGFQPDLIVLDVMMPEMDGPSTLQALRGLPQLAKVPIVFMTAKVQPHEIAQHKALGAFDVIAKPFDPMQLSATISAIWRRHLAVVLEEDIRSLAADYIADLPATLAQIEQHWAEVRQLPGGVEIAPVYRLIHTVHGTGATLGLHALSEVAQKLEVALAPLRGGPAATEQQLDGIDSLMQALRQVVAESIATFDQSKRTIALEPQQPAWSLIRSAPLPGAPNPQGIVLAEVDAEVAYELSTQLGFFGYTVYSMVSIDELRNQVDQLAPMAIITDARALKADRECDDRLLKLGQQYAEPPAIIVISEHGDIDTRLRAVRAGSNAFFTKPVNINALIDKLDHFTSRHAAEPGRILIVDDQPELAHTYAALLHAAGMLTVVVTDPLQIMPPLIEFRPDMILMDMYMPSCDGKTLAAVIRQQEDYVGIPIVFLSAETNRDTQLAAMQLGADDFMAKPILPEHLISAVRNRIDRARVLRSLMTRDSLTGLFNHTAIKERLAAEINRATRDQKPLAFALLDIDHFKQVNDTYGHPTGDWVLKSLSRLLQQRLRRTDIIGRYGGEEFAVVLPDTSGEVAAQVLDEIRSGLAHIRQHSDEHEFTVTFSCGVACFADYPEATRMTNAADKALYSAKHGGRNRVVLSKLEG